MIDLNHLQKILMEAVTERFQNPAMCHHHWMVMRRINPHDSILACKL